MFYGVNISKFDVLDNTPTDLKDTREHPVEATENLEQPKAAERSGKSSVENWKRFSEKGLTPYTELTGRKETIKFIDKETEAAKFQNSFQYQVRKEGEFRLFYQK